MAALEGYLTDTASALFALAARIAGSPTAEVEHVARHAGLAQGLTDVIAALPRDASRRQLFVPQQLLESRGGNMEEVFSGKATPRIRAALDQLIAEARQHLETSLALLSDMPREIAPIFLPLAVVRRESERMSRPDIDPFKPLCPLEAVNLVDVVAGVEVSGLQRPVASQWCSRLQAACPNARDPTSLRRSAYGYNGRILPGSLPPFRPISAIRIDGLSGLAGTRVDRSCSRPVEQPFSGSNDGMKRRL